MAVLSSPIKSTSSLARKQKTEGKVKGADSVLKASSKKLQLPDNDDTPVTITKVNKIVETKVKRLQPKITKKVRSAIKPFDPRKMLSDIFKGGLGQLEKFAKSLAGLKKPLGEIFKFINKAKNIFLSLLKKLTKIKLAPKTEPGKKEKKKKGGLIGNILKGAATLGLIALTTWGISKLLDRGKEDKEVKPGESTVKSVEPLEGTELLNKKEVKKFNKALKVFQQALWDFEEQVKKAADSKPKPEEETKEDKPTTDNEKVQSLAGTTQTALIPGDLAPAELNVLVPKVEDAGGEKDESTTETSQETATTANSTSTVIPKDADHGTSGGTTTAGGGDNAGDGTTATAKSKPLGTENVTSTTEGDKGSQGTEGSKGARGEAGPQGFMRFLAGTGDVLTANMFDFDQKNTDIETPEGEKPKGFMRWMAGAADAITGDTWNLDKVNQTRVDPDKSESDLRRENSLGVSRTAEGESSPQTNETVINVPPGTSTEQALPKSGNQVARTPDDASASVRVPFFIAVDGSNFALLHSKSQYNIVDAL
tara:strand:+ start:895 stop:2505 length:1611 start_codon:yes stop_codon:yes gene_type:complete